MERQFILQPYKGAKTRFICPQCKSSDRTFTLYVNLQTGEYVSNITGICDRINNCGYHYTPKQFFADNKGLDNVAITNQRRFIKADKADLIFSSKVLPDSYIHSDILKATLKDYENNCFVKYLISHFGVKVASVLVARYFIGTSKHWQGATIYWQIDTNGKIRSGKVMLYSPITGKRSKDPLHRPTWVHSLLKEKDFNLKQCLFGGHLLNVSENHIKPVAIVESEKTAIIASAYLPQFIWLATGGLSNLNAEKCEILKGRKVVLFPDLGGFDKWSEKAKDLSSITTFTVSKLLENGATEEERKHSFDLADYLIKYDLNDFIQAESKECEKPHLVHTSKIENEEKHFTPTAPAIKVESKILKDSAPSNWDKEIQEIENFYISIDPTAFRNLNFESGCIFDLNTMVNSHLSFVKSNNGKKAYKPYLETLQRLQNHLTA